MQRITTALNKKELIIKRENTNCYKETTREVKARANHEKESPRGAQ